MRITALSRRRWLRYPAFTTLLACLAFWPQPPLAARNNPAASAMSEVLMGALWNHQAHFEQVADFAFSSEAAGWMEVSGGHWYLFLTEPNFQTRPSYCSSTDDYARIVVRESTDHGQSWSSAYVVAEPNPNNSSMRCALTDGSAFYDSGSNTWHLLVQCAGGYPDSWNLCHYTRASSSPLGTFTSDSANPVVDGGDLFSQICSSICPSNTLDEGTPDIMYKDGSYYYVTFHGWGDVGGSAPTERFFRGVARTTNFTSFQLTGADLPGHPMFGPDDCQSWQPGCLGGGHASTLATGRWYYMLIENFTVNFAGHGCSSQNTFGFALVRSESLATSGSWDGYSSNFLFPPMGSDPCSPSYPSWFVDDDRVYLLIQGRDGSNQQREYIYEVVLNYNLGGGILLPGATRGADESRASGNAQYNLHYGGDGILRLNRSGDGIPIWDIVESASNPGYVEMGTNGNLVIYNGNSQNVWSSGTSGNPGAYLIVQNDGNMVIYSSGGEPLWCTSTGLMNNDHLLPDHSLFADEEITTANNEYALRYQGDGNLVLYQPGVGVVWTAGVGTSNPGRAIMQRDGSLVLYDGSNNTYGFSTPTSGHRNAFLQVEGGQIVIYSSSDWPHSVLWVRPTPLAGPSLISSFGIAPYRLGRPRIDGTRTDGNRPPKWQKRSAVTNERAGLR